MLLCSESSRSCPKYLFIWLFICLLYNKLVTVSKVLPEFWETVNYQPEVGGHRNLQLVASRQKYRSSGTFIQHLKWEKSCGTEPLTCGVSVNSGVNSRVELNCRIPKRCPESEELVAVGENPHFISEVSVNSAQNTAMG